MSEPKWRLRLRLRLYGVTLIVALLYLLIGRLSSPGRDWVEVDLWLSAAAVLMFGLAGVEAYFVIQRWQERYRELQAARARERELTDRLSEQRRQILNQISLALLDQLNLRRLPRDVVEKMALLFECDVVGVWLASRDDPGFWVPRGVCGLSESAARELGAIGQGSPAFEKVLQQARQLAVTDFGRDTAPAMAAFCEREGLVAAVLTPVQCRDRVVGVIGAFYRQPREVSASLAAEMQTVANLITGVVQAEELCRSVAESQKIDSFANVATGIAHDFNNVLAAALACVSHVKQHTDPGSPSFRHLVAAESSIYRGAALSQQLLSFARRGRTAPKVLDPNKVIESTLNLLQPSFEKHFHIERRLAPAVHPVEINDTELEQVVLNICLNAREAMPQGGTLTVSTRNLRLDAAAPERAKLALPDGDYVVLAFRDTGHGMSEEVRRRVFEPFFTTKQPADGKGLGLTLVQNIVQNAGGDVTVESAPGRGALFEVFLPASAKPSATPGPSPSGETRGRGEHILLVEDEEVIREMTRLALESQGYTVTTASDGATALALYQQHWKQIDLVIADMVMPRLSGMELLSRMKEINPRVRVIVSSGFSRELEGQQMLQHGCLGYLQKPYDPQLLQRLVRSVLDSVP